MNSMKDSPELSYGKRLQEARRNAGLSTESVAESLRLDYRFVVALEEENAEVLPAPTYTRGYIRAYAQLVRCDADELIAQYNTHADGDPELTDIIPTSVEKPGSGPLIFWITCAVIVALIALLIVWAYDNLHPLNLRVGESGEQAAQTQQPVSPDVPDEAPAIDPGLSDLPLDSTAQSIQDPVPHAQQSDVPGSGLSGPETETDSIVEAPADSTAEIDEEVTFADEVQSTPPKNRSQIAPLAPSGTDVLRLDFQGQSWAEIVDANGFQLAYGLFGSRTLNLKGQAPFRVKLGDATQVDITVNGAEIELKSYIRWNNTAHLSVGKSRNPD